MGGMESRVMELELLLETRKLNALESKRRSSNRLRHLIRHVVLFFPKWRKTISRGGGWLPCYSSPFSAFTLFLRTMACLLLFPSSCQPGGFLGTKRDVDIGSENEERL